MEAQALAQSFEGSILSVNIPGGRVFFQGDDVRPRVVLTWTPGRRLSDPVVHYEVREADTGALVASGATAVNQTIAGMGWIEFQVDVAPPEEIAWYRASLRLEAAGEPIPLVDRVTGEARDFFLFGVVGENAGAATLDGGSEARAQDGGGAAGAAGAAAERKVMAFYYTWYGNPGTSKSWIHWPEGGHDPDTFDARGLSRIGATHHPILGPYDSQNRKVIDLHLRWAQAAGIDVLIATWWGRGDVTDRALVPLLEQAAGTGVEISLYYETVPGGRPEAFVQDMRYILSTYGDHPAFFKHRGAPVVFVYGRAIGQLTPAQWQEAIRTLKAEHDVVLIADSTDGRMAEIFDGLHMYNPVGQVVGGGDMQHLYETAIWAAASRGKISSVTVIPGYDDSNIGRAMPIVASRRDGALYDELWDLAVKGLPDWVLITSFNEWHEGSEIEPSFENGDLYLRKTAEWARRFKSAPRRTLWVERSTFPVLVQAGQGHPIRIDVFRQGGGSDDAGDPVEVHWDLPEGWSVAGVSQTARGNDRLTLAATLEVPAGVSPGKYEVAVELALGDYATRLSVVTEVPAPGAGQPFEGVGVWARLGDPNVDMGITQRDHEDGVTRPVTVAGSTARRTAPGVDVYMYMYFDIADRFLFDIDGTPVEVGIEYLDRGTGTFVLQYDSHNPAGDVNGAYMNATPIPLQDTGEWKWAKVTLTDARFANRQNGGTDFRLTARSQELVVRTVYVKLLE